MAKEKKPSKPPVPIIKRSPDFRTLYVTGAVGNITPFDYRLVFYNHESEFPEEPKETTGVPVSQVFQVELVMSYELMRKLRDLLDRQVKTREAAKKKEEKGE